MVRNEPATEYDPKHGKFSASPLPFLPCQNPKYCSLTHQQPVKYMKLEYVATNCHVFFLIISSCTALRVQVCLLFLSHNSTDKEGILGEFQIKATSDNFLLTTGLNPMISNFTLMSIADLMSDYSN